MFIKLRQNWREKLTFLEIVQRFVKLNFKFLVRLQLARALLDIRSTRNVRYTRQSQREQKIATLEKLKTGIQINITPFDDLLSARKRINN